MKGSLKEFFSQEIVVPKDTTFTTDSTFRGFRINTAGSTRHGGQKKICRPWMASLLKILQYAYHRKDWRAFNIKLNVMPCALQHLDEPLALEGRELISLILNQVAKDVKSYCGYYRIHLERDVVNEGGYHYHIALVAKGIQSEAAIEIAFRAVQKAFSKYVNSYINFIAPDIARVKNKEDREYFEALGIKPDGSKKFLELDSDASYEYMAFVYSYHAKLYTKEFLIKEKIKIASGNRIKSWHKGIHQRPRSQHSVDGSLYLRARPEGEINLIHQIKHETFRSDLSNYFS